MREAIKKCLSRVSVTRSKLQHNSPWSSHQKLNSDKLKGYTPSESSQSFRSIFGSLFDLVN